MTPRKVLSWAGLIILCSAAWNFQWPTLLAAKEPDKSAAAESKAAVAPFKDEPAAHALYNQMIDAMRKTKSFSYVSRCSSEGKEFKQEGVYRAWLKKPNCFRVEADFGTVRFKGKEHKTGSGIRGILIGDGTTLWIYWPQGRSMYGSEDAATYAKTRMTSYMTSPAPPGGHSIGHEMCYIGPFPILDPSTFFGYTDSLQRYLDGIKSLGTEKVAGEDCDKIELSIMKHQRSWFLWLSKRDHLPRKLKQIVRVSYDLVITEDWSSVTIDGDIADTMFVWKPPKGWTPWKLPEPEDKLLKPGTKGPDFDLASADGRRIKMSDFRGQVVWLYIWRAG
jgi:outer membrane lipoprotein-sorting protein